jgi:hypothetical protein
MANFPTHAVSGWKRVISEVSRHPAFGLGVFRLKLDFRAPRTSAAVAALLRAWLGCMLYSHDGIRVRPTYGSSAVGGPAWSVLRTQTVDPSNSLSTFNCTLGCC